MLAFDVIEKMGLSDPVAAAKEAMSKLPDHAPVNDIQTVLDEMNKLSLSPVCYKQTHPIKDQKFSFSIE